MKKLSKKLLSLLLAASLLTGLLPAGAMAAPKTNTLPFTDVKTSDWFYEPVQYAYENGLMAGTGDRIFDPNVTTTRGMIVTILHRMEGSPSVSSSSFSDVSSNQWYATAVNWAAQNGVVSGYSNGKFGPNDPITREQMASIMMRYSEFKGYDVSASDNLSKFTDRNQISDYAVDVMKWAVGSGLLSGRGNNLLAPQGQTTRAEAATILMRYCEDIAMPSKPETPPDEETCTVTFDSNGGSNVSSQEVRKGESAKEPVEPRREGYTFMGWQEQGLTERYDFSSKVTNDITLIALWGTDVGSGNSLYTFNQDQVSYDETEKVHYVNDIILAFVQDGLSEGEKQQIADSVNGSIVGDIADDLNLLQIKIAKSTLSEINDAAANLKNDSRVVYACQDTPIRANDLEFTSDLSTASSENTDWWYSAINADKAWNEYSEYFSPIKVGVIDSSIDLQTEDIKGKVTFANDYFGVLNSLQRLVLEEKHNMHGTQISQLITGRDDNQGVTGIAHNSDIVFASFKSNYTPSGEQWQSSLPVHYALACELEKGAKVINCSFGQHFYDRELYQEKTNNEFATYGEYVASATRDCVEVAELTAMFTCQLIRERQNNAETDFLIVQAAGNGMNNSGVSSLDVWYASWWNGITSANASGICQDFGISYEDLDSHIINVSSILQSGGDGLYSMDTRCHYGDAIDIYAPGVNIFSPGDWGTSYAAPIVSGVAALVWSVDPSLKAYEVRDILLNNYSSQAIGAYNSIPYRKPVVDAYEAVKAAVDGSSEEEGPIPIEHEYGNTNSNTQNQGLVVSDNEYVYFIDRAYSKLYRMKKDGSDRELLVDKVGTYLNLVDDWLYYSDYDGIYKVRTDGSDKRQIGSVGSYDLIIVDDWIYYTDYSGGNLYKVQTNGQNNTKLNTIVSAFSVVGDEIYYAVNENNGYSINKMNTDGTEKICLARENSGEHISQLICEDGQWIYFTKNGGSVDSGKVEKISTDGNQRYLFDCELLSTGGGPIGISTINVIDNWIYYFSNESSPKVYKVSVDGAQIVEVGTAVYANGAQINVVDNNIYYSSNGGFLFSMKTDGTDWKQIAPIS